MTVACPVCGGRVVIPAASPANSLRAIAGHAAQQRRLFEPAFAMMLVVALFAAVVAGVWLLKKAPEHRTTLPERPGSAAPVQAHEAKETESSEPVDAQPVATRTLSFPAGQRVGTVYLEPKAGPGWDPIRVELPYTWEDLGAAQGEICVPKDRNVQLLTRLALTPQESATLRARMPMKHHVFEASRIRQDPQDLSGLAGLGANDLQRLTIDSLIPVAGADRRVLEPIRHLTGLQILSLYDTGVTDEGMKQLKPLRSLRTLSLNESAISHQGLTVLMDLPALERLNLDMPVTDAALKPVGQQPNLRWLRLRTGKIQGPGLAELALLPRLEHLCLWGEADLTDQHVQHLEGLARLKSLTIWGVGDKLTDASLASIGKLKELEELHFIRANPRFSLAGVAHLYGLTNLKAVDFGGTWGSPLGIRYGDDLARELAVNLPQLECLKGVNYLSAAGLKALTALENLRSLAVGLIDRKHGYEGPTGLSHLADLPRLEELSICTGGTLSDADLAGLEPLGRLRDLAILSPPLTDGCLASIGKLTRLESLWLNCASHRGLNELNSLPTLQKLHVSTWPDAVDAYSSDETLLDIKGLKNLRNLNLSGLRLQDGDLAFLEHLPRLEEVFIATESLTGGFLRHLKHLPELGRLTVSRLCGCTSEHLANLNGLPKLRHLNLTGDVAGTALASLTGPSSLLSLDVSSGEPILKQAVAELTKSHPALEYINVNPAPARPPH
jgi:hypothetical protein